MSSVIYKSSRARSSMTCLSKSSLSSRRLTPIQLHPTWLPTFQLHLCIVNRDQQSNTITMARNGEKAQSMLYRFRETQAVEMGLGNRQKGDRRPRMASSVTNLRECERWRGDILRDIGRKVSKIQDGASGQTKHGEADK
jgi:hypothetical protein